MQNTERVGAFPFAPLAGLDVLWIQVAGTICNLKCTHCFISCSPTNHSHEMMTLKEIRPLLDEAKKLGVKEYYFTGGEPFLNRELLAILELTLKQGPASVLTNGILISSKVATQLNELSTNSEYSLDIRVSLDGYDAETHDAIRGRGMFQRAIKGIVNLKKA